MNKILIVSTCREKLHYYEFVRPIEDILSKEKLNFKTMNYLDASDNDIQNAEKIIICGTSLKDTGYQNHLEKFDWIKETNKTVLGICAGMQIIGLVNGAKLKGKTEVGYFHETFTGEFLGLKGKQEVYHLHNNYIEFKDQEEFEVYTQNKISQAIQHKKKNIYGTLFHPEVRQKQLIINFTKL